MPSQPASDELGDLLRRVGPEVAGLVRATDELIRRTDPDVVAVYWPHQRTAGYGVGPKTTATPRPSRSRQ